MKNKIETLIIAFLVIGTLGLILNEFVLSWGSNGTIAFALFNIVGLVLFFINRDK